MKKFILARYGTGTGGKFLCCLLQLSPDVNTWDQELETAKAQQDHDLIYKYFRYRFGNFETWLDHEPHVPYKCGPVANLHTFDYDKISWEQAWPLLIEDAQFVEHYNNSKKTLLISSHSRVPQWLWNKTVCVNMHIDNVVAKKWVHRAMARKLFRELEPGVFGTSPASGKDLYLTRVADPNFIDPARMRFAGSKFSFMKRFICNSKWTLVYQDYKKILAHPTNTQAQQTKFDISNIRSCQTYYQAYEDLCAALEITCPDRVLVQKLIDYYIKLH